MRRLKGPFFITIFTLASNLLLAQTYPVAWQELKLVTVDGDNSLTKTQAGGTYNAGAASQNMILSREDVTEIVDGINGIVNFVIRCSIFPVRYSIFQKQLSLDLMQISIREHQISNVKVRC